MKISANLTDRFLTKVLPAAVMFGIIATLFSGNKIQTFVFLTPAFGLVIFLIEISFIKRRLGSKLNRIDLTDKILFNDKAISPNEIVKIETKNIYPSSIISKWNIYIITFHLADKTTFEILAKPHSIIFFIKYLTNIISSHLGNLSKDQTDAQRGYSPASSYVNREMTKTLTLLFEKYPELERVRS